MRLNEMIENNLNLKGIRKVIKYLDLRKITLDGGNNVLLELSSNAFEDPKKEIT